MATPRGGGAPGRGREGCCAKGTKGVTLPKGGGYLQHCTFRWYLLPLGMGGLGLGAVVDLTYWGGGVGMLWACLCEYIQLNWGFGLTLYLIN